MKILDSILRGFVNTNLHVIGSTRSGKTKFDDWILRNVVAKTKCGVIVIDRHGTLAEPFVKFLAFVKPKRKVIYLNPSEPEWIVPFNFFHAQDGADITTMVSRLMDATLASWNELRSEQRPRMERILRATFHFVISDGETLPNAEMLLQYPKKELRHYASEKVQDPYIREVWRELSTIASPKDWRDQVESSVNRLMRIVGPPAIRRFIGLRGGLDVETLLNEDAIIILNLKESDHLGTEAAQFFASIFIAQLFSAALRRAGTKHRTLVCLDEFQEFMSPNIARSLDQAAKGGLRFILSHQRLGHLEQDEELRNAIFTNCKMRATFGGNEFGDAAYIAQHDLLHTINSRQILETYKHTASMSHLEEFENKGETSGSTTTKTPPDQTPFKEFFFPLEHQEVTASAHASTQKSMSRMLIPEYFEEVSSRSERSRDEKVSVAAAQLMFQPQRHCHLKLPDMRDAFPFVVPVIRDVPIPVKKLQDYLTATREELPAVSAGVADKLLEESRTDFIHRAQNGHKELVAVSKNPPRISRKR